MRCGLTSTQELGEVLSRMARNKPIYRELFRPYSSDRLLRPDYRGGTTDFLPRIFVSTKSSSRKTNPPDRRYQSKFLSIHMSTPRRMFEDPRNTYFVENNDPAAFDKRFVGRPSVHREQQCCRNRAPIWQSYMIHDGDDADNGNRPAYKTDDPLQVQDATGESDNVTGRNQLKGYVWVEGPRSGYKPEFVSPEEWMRWQGVHWIPSPIPMWFGNQIPKPNKAR
jgi:hypothetical protein